MSSLFWDFTKYSQKPGTRGLTWLTIGVILQLEQRKGIKDILLFLTSQFQGNKVIKHRMKRRDDLC